MNEEEQKTSEKKVMVAAHVSPCLSQKIKSDAEDLDRSVSWVVNDILTKWYESKEGETK